MIGLRHSWIPGHHQDFVFSPSIGSVFLFLLASLRQALSRPIIPWLLVIPTGRELFPSCSIKRPGIASPYIKALWPRWCTAGHRLTIAQGWFPRGKSRCCYQKKWGDRLQGRVIDAYYVMLCEELDPRGVRGWLILPQGRGRVTGTSALGLKVLTRVC